MAKVCSNCGAQCVDSFNSCFSCGAKLEISQPQQANPTYENSSSQQAYQQPTYAQQGYQQPIYAPPMYREIDETVSVGGWIGVFLLLGIPIVNIIMIILWAFSSSKPSLKNFAVAAIIMFIVSAVLFFILLALGVTQL